MEHDINLDVQTIRAFRRFLRALEREIDLSLNKETTCCGVTTAQCHFILETQDRAAASLSELADALALDSSTLSRTADGLFTAGFILRDADPENRRKVSIRLSDAGKTKVDSINELCDDSVRRLFGYVPSEKRALVVEAVELLSEAMKRKRKDEREPCCCRSARKKEGAMNGL